MGHDHSHAHGHDIHARGDHIRPMAMTLALVVLYTGVEVAGGLLSGSLALLADAGHMLSDAGALALTLFAMRFARKPPTATQTYGFYRVEILAALANGATLVGIALFIFVEAYDRFRNPPEVEGALMLVVAVGGLIVNALGLWILQSARHDSLNVRGAWLHVLTDALGSVQAIAAGALIWVFGWRWVDPLASVLIGALVVYSSWTLLQQAVTVLMEGAPGHIDVDAVRNALLNLPGVSNVHDLHVWTITSGFVALSAHLSCVERDQHEFVLRAAQDVLVSRFHIRHTTIQIDVHPFCDGAAHPSVA
jgi:cobalt-zinc-cadmium efflux system protein